MIRLTPRPSRKRRTYLADQGLPIRPVSQQRKLPPYSCSAEANCDLERILGRRPELIARLARSIAPAGIVIGPMFERLFMGQGEKGDQWRSLSRALALLEQSLAALS